MEQQEGMHEIARLEAIARGEGGAPALPALAQAYRRGGRPEEAERVAREGVRRLPDQPAARVALGLALLDQGRAEEARVELERVLDAVPGHALARAALPQAEPSEEALTSLDDAELDRAFAAAESHRDEMLDADGVVAAAVRAVELEPEADSVPEEVVVEEAPAPASPFATRTMVNLLERQGHREEAHRMRGSLDEEESPGAQRREQVVATLEGWLHNLRKERS